MNDIRKDFFIKLEEIQEQFSKVYDEIFKLKNQPKQELDEETIISKVLQKMPVKADFNEQKSELSFDKETLIKEILSKIPSGGNKVYEVAPLEKIKKDFLEEGKNKVLRDIEGLDEESKKIIKFIESIGRRTNLSEVMEKGLLINPASGSRNRIQKKIQELFSLEISRKDGGHVYPNLKEKSKKFMEIHEATEQEIEQVYNHILMEMLK